MCKYANSYFCVKIGPAAEAPGFSFARAAAIRQLAVVICVSPPFARACRLGFALLVSPVIAGFTCPPPWVCKPLRRASLSFYRLLLLLLSEIRWNTAQAAFAVEGESGEHIPGGCLHLPRNPRYANRNARNALRRRIAAMGAPCHLCGQPIDYSLPAGHPLSFELDELIPLAVLPPEQRAAAAIDPRNVAPAHRICNERRGAKPLIAPVVRGMRIKTSERW